MIFKFKPIPLIKIWGGNSLSKKFGFKKKNIGEIIGISAHNESSNIILNGKHKGISLKELFDKHRKLFGNYSGDEFPILLKIIDAKDDLSIQVHPNDKYALKNEGSLGKSEAWYILECGNKSKIQIGHKANSLEDIKKFIEKEEYDKFLKYYSIRPGDFFYVKSGTIHSICKNTKLLEVSQSSNLTYRIFDYNRKIDGKKRELHLKKALEVVNTPCDYDSKHVTNEHFRIRIMNNTSKTFISDEYGDYLYIIDGKGFINNENINSGDFLMVSSSFKYNIIGNIKLAIVNIK